MENIKPYNDMITLCPMLNLIRCEAVDECAWKCENGECAIAVIAKAVCADGERKEDAEKMHPVECDAKDCKYKAFVYSAKKSKKR